MLGESELVFVREFLGEKIDDLCFDMELSFGDVWSEVKELWYMIIGNGSLEKGVLS